MNPKKDHYQAAMDNFADLDFISESGNIRVTLEYIDEGWCGEYDENDPNDAPLLRFSVDQKVDASYEWSGVENASYCTRIPIDTDRAVLDRIGQHILRQVEDPLSNDYSIKRLCEKLSWISPEEFQDDGREHKDDENLAIMSAINTT